MITDYVSLDYVIERFQRTGIEDEATKVDFKEWTYQAMERIGSIEPYMEVKEVLEVVSGRAMLPINHQTSGELPIYDNQKNVPLTRVSPGTRLNEWTYYIKNGHVYLGFEEGAVTINYYAFPADNDGEPMIPDNEYYVSAVEAYFIYRTSQRLYYRKKILFNEYKEREQNWYNYAAAANAESKMVGRDRIRHVSHSMFPSLSRFRSE